MKWKDNLIAYTFSCNPGNAADNIAPWIQMQQELTQEKKRW